MTATGDPTLVTFGALTPERDAAAIVIALQTFVALYDHRQGPVDELQVDHALAAAAAVLRVMGQPIELESPLTLGVPADHAPALPTSDVVWRVEQEQ